MDNRSKNSDKDYKNGLDREYVPMTVGAINAHEVLRSCLPEPNYGVKDMHTVSSRFRAKQHLVGNVAEWLSFKDEVLTFYRSPEMRKAIDCCEHKLVSVHPETHKLHRNFDTRNRAQVGNETSLSGVFFQHVLEPVLAVCEAFGEVNDNHNLNIPEDLTFGDSWVNPARLVDARPDIVMKRRGADEIRLLGELKIAVSVDLKKIADEAADKIIPNSKAKLCGILGQVVFYMAKYRLKHAFISNYDHTIFVMQGFKASGDPCIYFSRAILMSDVASGDPKRPSISMRLALLFMIAKSCAKNPADWRLSDKITEEEWVEDKSGPPGLVGTPLDLSKERGKPDELVAKTATLTLGNPSKAPPSSLLAGMRPSGPETRSRTLARTLGTNIQGPTPTTSHVSHARESGFQDPQPGSQRQDIGYGLSASTQTGRRNNVTRKDDNAEQRAVSDRSRPTGRRGSSRGSRRGTGG